MGQALYRKYRSQKLSEVIGQEHVTSTLGQALKTGRISHAYLFTGPHGVGKTSVARILAHEINKIPYEDDSVHMDIIEIDAASNRRIDEIRELREKVYIAPTSAKFKVYIIDEVHMLTREAFNALLKTLEEPPAHVVFILATTDAHKLPDTIVSRTQRFTFKPVEKNKVIEHLRYIADQEKIKVSEEALNLLAEHGAGSFRDSISLLDQASNQNRKLEINDVLTLLGIPPKTAIENIISLASNIDGRKKMMVFLSDLYSQGYQAPIIGSEISTNLRSQIIDDKLTMPIDTALELLSDLIEVGVSHDPGRLLEIQLLRAINSLNPTPHELVHAIEEKTQEQLEQQKPIAEAQISIKPTQRAEIINAESNILTELEADKKINKQEIVSHLNIIIPSKDSDEIWQKILSALKRDHNTLYGIVRMAHPEFSSEGILRLTFNFAFHKKRIEEAKNQNLLTTIITNISGQNYVIECILDKDTIAVKSEAKQSISTSQENVSKKEPDELIAINAIFGGGELLES
jgi:DNA polymerase-3 subunit gamma/tau